MNSPQNQVREFPTLISTERLILRSYQIADAAGMLELVRQNREDLIREFKEQASLQNVSAAESFVANKLELWNAAKAFCYGIFSRDQQIGQIQLKNIDWEIPSGELGYFIGESWQRRGYASEAIKALARMAFDDFGFERIFVRILLSNQPSLRLALKLGFQEEGIHRKAFRCGFGELNDVRHLALLRKSGGLTAGVK
jgi:RimJ/RimL family protein N-acetyltransferase